VDNGSDLVVMRYLQFDCNCDLHDDKRTNNLRRWNAKKMIKERKAGALCAASKEQRRAEQTGGRQKQAASGVLPKDSAAKPSGAEQFHERSAGPAERCLLRSKPERSGGYCEQCAGARTGQAKSGTRSASGTERSSSMSEAERS
jgi:hypothetical protein